MLSLPLSLFLSSSLSLFLPISQSPNLSFSLCTLLPTCEMRRASLLTFFSPASAETNASVDVRRRDDPAHRAAHQHGRPLFLSPARHPPRRVRPSSSRSHARARTPRCSASLHRSFVRSCLCICYFPSHSPCHAQIVARQAERQARQDAAADRHAARSRERQAALGHLTLTLTLNLAAA